MLGILWECCWHTLAAARAQDPSTPGCIRLSLCVKLACRHTADVLHVVPVFLPRIYLRARQQTEEVHLYICPCAWMRLCSLCWRYLDHDCSCPWQISSGLETRSRAQTRRLIDGDAVSSQERLGLKALKK